MLAKALVRKVLLLGEGNFSFAWAAVQRLRDSSLDLPEVRFTVTSFDSREAVLEKYPESASILSSLAICNNTGVIHNVDATHIERSFAAGSTFSEIWFNFPHLGKEDMHRHMCLVAHYFHSAKSCVEPGGTICVALSDEQQRNWDIQASAVRLGLCCVAAVPLVAEHWPGYRLRRHHNGRSFADKIQNSFHYCFRREDEQGDSSLLEALAASIAAKPTTSAGKSKPRKRVHHLVDGKFEYVEGQGFVCNECQRSFPTEQGARTHVYNMHILNRNEAIGDIGGINCPHCDKTFANAAALRMHDIAKHSGENNLILPYWKQSQSAETQSPSSASSHSCDICQWKFDSAEQLALHLSHGLFPEDEDKQFVCPICGDQFGQERALLQHRNFCNTNVALKEA